MWGFKSFGSIRWAANSDANVAAVNYLPGTATIIFEGLGPPVATGLGPITSHQMAREVLHAGTGLVDVYQMAREVLRASNSANTNIVVRQMIRETLRSSNLGQTGIVVRQMVRETLRSTAEANLRRRQLILPNVGPFG